MSTQDSPDQTGPEADGTPETPFLSGLHTIRLRNFRRYEDATLHLKPGLNFLEGENNAGKTSVLYAIEYALFGSVGALKPAGLMRPKSRTVGVELVFTGRDGQTYRLQRVHIKPPKSRSTVHGHFTLKVRDEDAETYVLSSDFDDLETDLALALQRALGVTRRSWELAVHHQQGRITEILDGTSKLDMVLGVTSAVFVEEELRAMALEREKAAKELPVLDGRIQQLTAERVERAERVEALEAEQVRVEEAQQAVAVRGEALATRRQALDEAGEAVEALVAAKTRLNETNAEVTRCTARRDGLGERAALEAAAQTARAASGPLEERRTAARERVRALQDQSRELAAKLGDVAGRLERRQDLTEGGLCDACGQVVDAAHLAAEIPVLQAEKAEVSQQIATLDAQITDEESVVEATESALSDARVALAAAESAVEAFAAADEELQAASDAAEEAKGAVETARTAAEAAVEGVAADDLAGHVAAEREALTGDSARLDADREHAAERVERTLAELAEGRDAVKRCDRELAELKTKADGLRADAEVAQRLRVLGKAFKSVQQDLREQASAQMGERAFAIHQHLSGDDRELKKLEIDPKKYTVNVTPRDVGTKVPASLYQGGGHRLLLGLAVKLALAEQIGPVPFVLLDEPTYGLDARRKSALLERISELEVADQLVLITHAQLGDARGHRLSVVRDGNRSVITASEGT